MRSPIRLFTVIISSLGVRILGAYMSKVVKKLLIKVK
jgi:hypothetical protein